MRFVVLQHSGVAEPHYDLMVETSPGSALATWRVSHWPPRADEVFTALAEHRREYLDYEGAVSGDRGTVRRVAAGACRVIQTDTGSLGICWDDGKRIVLPIFQRA